MHDRICTFNVSVVRISVNIISVGGHTLIYFGGIRFGARAYMFEPCKGCVLAYSGALILQIHSMYNAASGKRTAKRGLSLTPGTETNEKLVLAVAASANKDGKTWRLAKDLVIAHQEAIVRGVKLTYRWFDAR